MKVLRCASDEVQDLTLTLIDGAEFEIKAVGKKENSLQKYYELDVAVGMFEFKKELLNLEEYKPYIEKKNNTMKDLDKIINLLIESADDLDDMHCEFEDNKYYLEVIDGEKWEDDNKYQNRFLIGELVKNGERLNIYYGQGQTRVGSHFSGYEKYYEDIKEVEKYEKIIKVIKWKIKGEQQNDQYLENN